MAKKKSVKRRNYGGKRTELTRDGFRSKIAFYRKKANAAPEGSEERRKAMACANQYAFHYRRKYGKKTAKKVVARKVPAKVIKMVRKTASNGARKAA